MPRVEPGRRARTVAGVPVHVHWSVAVLALVQLATAHPAFVRVTDSLPVALLAGTITTVGVLWSILRHEVAHAVEARRRGMAVQGVHLLALGGATAIRESDAGAGATLRVAAVGPWRSLRLAALFGLAAAGLTWFGWLPVVALGLGILGWFNLGLAVFNLLPAAPLDGGRILAATTWRLTGSRGAGERAAAVGGVVLGLGLWAVAGWLVLRAIATPAGVLPALWIGVVWTIVVAAFLSAAGVRAWIRASTADATDAARVPALADPDHAPAGSTRSAPVPAAAPASRRGWRRWAVQAAWVGIVGLAGVVVPTPWVLYLAGPVTAADDGLQVEGATTDLNGEVMVLTVWWWHAGLLPTAYGAIAPDARLELHSEAIPAGLDDRTWLTAQQELFTSSLEQAAAAALAAAGEPVETTTRVFVEGLLANGPATGLLEPGDAIAALDGVPVTSAMALAEATAGRTRGDVVAMDITRDDTRMTVEVPIGPLPGDARVGIGIRVAERVTDLRLPRAVDSTVDHLGGPSAGLPTAIAVYDLVAEQDVLRGRRIAATGTMAADGTVDEIGGLGEKVSGAIRAGAELLLVPRSQEATARRLADERIEVRGVATLADALAILGPG